ncbi:MAG: hypothetical protein U1E78_03185 [Gammaproteobacteria bacterium]
MSHTFLSMSPTGHGKKDEHDLVDHANEAKKFNQGHSAQDKIAFDPDKLKKLPPMKGPEKKRDKSDSNVPQKRK